VANRKHRAIHNVEIDFKSASHFVIFCLSFGIVGGQADTHLSAILSTKMAEKLSQKASTLRWSELDGAWLGAGSW